MRPLLFFFFLTFSSFNTVYVHSSGWDEDREEQRCRSGLGELSAFSRGEGPAGAGVREVDERKRREASGCWWAFHEIPTVPLGAGSWRGAGARAEERL